MLSIMNANVWAIILLASVIASAIGYVSRRLLAKGPLQPTSDRLSTASTMVVVGMLLGLYTNFLTLRFALPGRLALPFRTVDELIDLLKSNSFRIVTHSGFDQMSFRMPGYDRIMAAAPAKVLPNSGGDDLFSFLDATNETHWVGKFGSFLHQGHEKRSNSCRWLLHWMSSKMRTFLYVFTTWSMCLSIFIPKMCLSDRPPRTISEYSGKHSHPVRHQKSVLAGWSGKHKTLTL